MTMALPETQAKSVGRYEKKSDTSFLTRLSYGIGAISYAVKDGGFNYFLLLFYSQVVGVDPRLVGFAILIALIFDAISDPVVGWWSDRMNSPLGRRHPFMYAAALPVAASYYFLWVPPSGWSDQSLFWYILGLAILIRTFITFYETPSTALGYELTSDYEERSTLISFRFFFGWVGGNAMTVFMFLVIFASMASEAIPNGQFNPESYRIYGVIASLLMFSAIMISAIGTHHRIKHLTKPKAEARLPPLEIFRQVRATLWERSFLSLFGAAMFGAVATGLTTALAFYFYSYFWGFSSGQTGLLTLAVFGSAVIGTLLAPIATRHMGKKRAAILIGSIAVIGSPLPIVLRLIGVMPENGNPFVFWFVFCANLIDVGLIICFQVLITSMMADLVEQDEVRNHRRSEGVFASAMTFVRKMVQGLGLMTATLVLVAADFPTGASPDEVSDAALFRFGLYYVPTVLLIWGGMICCIFFYRLTRAGHERNLAELAARREEVT